MEAGLKSKMPKNCCKYFTVSLVPVAALTLAILFVAAIVTLPVLYEELSHRRKYGVVIDAGSSHTDVYVYSWPIPRDTSAFTSGCLKEEYMCRSLGALSDYVHDPEGASKAFSSCLDDSYREEIPPDSARKHTNAYLGATAGMRLVNISNHTASDAIFKAVRYALHESKFSFHNQEFQARIIEESVEAASGWVTANYDPSHCHLVDDDNTVGSLDLGGASVEIAFIPPESYNLTGSEYRATVDVFGRRYDNIYARSYLCYGHNEALTRYQAYLVNHTTASLAVVNDPCLQRNYTKNVTVGQIFGSPCVFNSTTSVEAFGYEIHPPEWLGTGDTITFNGTGDPDSCNNTIKEVFNFASCTINDTCINGRYFWPPANNSKNFVAFSGFYYVSSFKKYDVTTLTPASLSSFSSKVRSFCNSSYSPATDNPVQCFGGAFVLHLLEAGFGFNNTVEDWSITFKQKSHGHTVGWALGYLMNITTDIPPKPYYTSRPYTAVDLVVGIVVLSILCVVFVVFFALTCNACRKVVRSRSGYTDIS